MQDIKRILNFKPKQVCLKIQEKYHENQNIFPIFFWRVLFKFHLPVNTLNYSVENIRKKKSLLPLLNWAVYSYPFSSRSILIYMSEDHTSPHNHTDMLWAYFSFVISLKLEFFSKSLNYRLLAFPYLDVWPILFVQMKLAVLAPQSLCSADPFFSFSMLPEFVLYLQWLFCIWFNNKGIL